MVSEQPTRPTSAVPQPGAPTPVTDHTRLDAPAAVRPQPTRADGPLGAHDRVGDRYRLVSPIAAGGMATVWRAIDEVLTRPVAIKVLHAHLAADPDFVARFRREAIAAARLAHPSIVAIYDTCDDPEAIVMELVEGRTLRQELDERGFLPPAEAAAIAASIAEALEVAHKAGLVHRDVKPANVLLAEGGQLKVADFGIAKAARADEHPDLPDLTSMGLMVGTAKYLAPEQVSGGPVDARTDVYALGAVLYEMLCGRPPFAGSNDLATATARLHALPERPRNVLRTIPPALEAIVMRAMATEPVDRYPSASAMWSDLHNVAHRNEPAAIERVTDATTIVGQQSFARSERSWLVPVSLVSLVAVALGLAWLLIGGTDARRDFIDLVDRVSPGGRTAAAEPVPAASLSAAAFDPLGDGEEHDGEAPLAVDGDPATGWTTERYESRVFGGLKSGVGLVVDLGQSTDVASLRIETPNGGWSATVHVGDRPADTLEGWGEAAATVDVASEGTTTVDLGAARGSYVLVWLTDLGTDGGVQFDLRELRVDAR